MPRKTFVVNAVKRTLIPESHQIQVGDEIECKLDQGKGVVVFEPDGPGPVLFVHGPSFDPAVPALASGQTIGEYPFSVCFWFEQGGQKAHGALQAVLIIDP